VVASARSSQSYEQIQPYLFAVAYRMTGSATDAEDLVHDAWIRYLDAGSPKVESLRAWLTTAVSRLALDHLKSARVRREAYPGPWLPEPVPTESALAGPEEALEQREEISMALLTLMERLTPEQRVVYVLRQGFGLPYDEIAEHVNRSAAACRQIFRRAQQRLAGERKRTIAPGNEHRKALERFMAAVQSGDVARVAELMSDDVVWLGDGGPHRRAGRRPIVGVDRVSRGLVGIARKARGTMDLRQFFVDLNGAPAMVITESGRLERVIDCDVRDGKITVFRTILNPDKLLHVARVLGLPVVESDADLPRLAARSSR